MRMPLRCHFYDTSNTAIANALAALVEGTATVDASRCPFAPGANGNVATENLLSMLLGSRIETGVDLDAIVEVSRGLRAVRLFLTVAIDRHAHADRTFLGEKL